MAFATKRFDWLLALQCDQLDDSGLLRRQHRAAPSSLASCLLSLFNSR